MCYDKGISGRPFMFGYASSEYDKHVYEEKLKDFLPDSFIDAHTHVYPASVMKNREPDYWPDRVAFENPIEDLKQTYADMFPDKKVTPVIFGNPKGDIAEGNEYCSRVSKREKLPALYLTHYNMSGEELERNVINGGFMGLKPYFCNARIGADPADADIFDFLPHEHLKIADKYGWVIMLHVSKRARLRDKSNVRQLMEIEQKYPNVKLIVAHVGRAYCEEDLGDAFDTLKKSEKMLFDFTANTLSAAMERCVEAVGVKRLMFGSDLPITKMKMYRVTENGNYVNVVPSGLYGDLSNASHMRETDEKNVTNFMYEELLALKKCATDLSLKKKDVEFIMRRNAEKVFNL